jgi:hypothetical protein
MDIGEDSQDRTAKTGQPEQDSQNGNQQRDSQNRIASTGQPEQDRQNMTARTGLAEQ